MSLLKKTRSLELISPKLITIFNVFSAISHIWTHFKDMSKSGKINTSFPTIQTEEQNAVIFSLIFYILILDFWLLEISSSGPNMRLKNLRYPLRN
jgi:hypothetical protein